MRHSATLVAAMEGVPRPVFRIAKELAANSRSGLTVRFLSKKLELPEEEVEYLVDIHHNLVFHDLTKVKLVAEGPAAVKRISDGLKNRGDVPSLFQLVKGMGPHEFRALEEQLNIDKPGPKKSAVECLIDQYYRHPDSIVEYVATRGFSPLAQEIFDAVWQSKNGVMAIAKIRAAVHETDYKLEQAILELFNGGALFEMFRFDDNDRLVRVAGLLAEIRAHRDANEKGASSRSKLRAVKLQLEPPDSRGLDLSDRICRIVAAIAAKPARVRSDGDLFREDRRRLSEIVPDDNEPNLATCLWMAQGVGWLAQVDNELRAADLESLLDCGRLERQRLLFEWLSAQGTESTSRRLVAELLDELKAGAWYPAQHVVHHALRAKSHAEEPRLMAQGGQWAYVAPGASPHAQRALTRSLEEAYLWLGVIDRAEENGEVLVRITDLGVWLLTGEKRGALDNDGGTFDAQIVVQPNFDIVVPSLEVDPLITVPLDQFAERQSTGTATVYHLSKQTFTRGIQDGHDGEAFVQFLLTHNRNGGLPKNVLQTLEDWRGSVKRVRVRTIHVLEADDPLVIADLMHRRRLNKYFKSIDPKRSIVFTKTTKTELTKELEKEGFVVG